MMSKTRIYELAKELGMGNKEFIDLLEKKFGVTVKSHMSTLEDDTVVAVRKLFEDAKKAEEQKKEKKPSAKEEPVIVKEPPKEFKKVEVPKAEPSKASDHVSKDDNIFEITLSPSQIKLNFLADKLKKSQTDIIKAMFLKGTILRAGQDLSLELAETIALHYNAILTLGQEEVVQPEVSAQDDLEIRLKEKWEKIYKERRKDFKDRFPVVTVMGHVDHGKTTLLDKIRNTKVAEKEAGGITQSIGAYQVGYKGKKISFIDTPGHEAFTEMRARGAQATDIVILIVAADDGVMPQTIEAYNHAKDAHVPVIVAINKIDKPNANVELTKQQLISKLNLVPEDWGGDTITVEISAKSGKGIDELLDMILLVAEMQEIKYYPKGNARAIIIESRLDKNLGPVATVIVKDGILKNGDFFVAGNTYGKVRRMQDDFGRTIKEATAPAPVLIQGFEDVPDMHSIFYAVDTLDEARSISQSKKLIEDNKRIGKKHIRLEEFMKLTDENKKKILNIILKSGTFGEIEALKTSIAKLKNPDVDLQVVHAGIGAVIPSDVMLASASDAVILGFRVKADSKTLKLAEQEGIQVKRYEIIFNLIDDIKKALEGMLEPEEMEAVTGGGYIKELFRIKKVGTIAGIQVTEGYVNKDGSVKLYRNGKFVTQVKIEQLKHYKDDVKSVDAPKECGMKFFNFDDLVVGDELEFLKTVQVERKLEFDEQKENKK